VKTNEAAAAADRAYIRSSGAQGMYPAMYYSHNLHFIAAASSMNGNYAKARKAAEMLAAHVDPLVKDMPALETFMTIPMAVDVRFQQWNEILRMPQPAGDRKITITYWHFARGMALAGTGKLPDAAVEYKTLAAIKEATPPDAVFSMPFNNKTKDVLTIAVNVLGAKIAMANKDSNSAVALLREAVTVQDALNYGEPPDWFSPVRESLGAALLISGNVTEAEKVFREDLERNPRNPRSLFGLQQALQTQGRSYDAEFVGQEFRTSWKSADTKLKVESLM
jgi:tetratricopeptide (TPR) repeat protein